MSDKEIDSSSDSSYLSALGSSKAYTATVSPLFYTHYGKSTWDKNCKRLAPLRWPASVAD